MATNYTPLDLAHVGDTTLDCVQSEFGIDLNNLVYIKQFRPRYHRLTKGDVQSIRQELKERYSDDGVDAVESLFEKMKRASYEPKTSQTYDWLVQMALEAPGSVRGGGTAVQELPAEAPDIYQAHYRITQAMLRNEFMRTPTLYRGLYPEEYLPLVRAMLDNAYKSAFVAHSPVVTSFSLSESTAKKFSEGVRMEWPLQDNAVAFAADLLREPPQSCQPEGEMHVLSGALILRPDRFQLCLSTEQPLISVIKRMATPADLTDAEHQDLLLLLEHVAKAKLQTKTPQATNRLWQWYRYCERNEVFDEAQEYDIAKGAVTAISGKRNWQPRKHEAVEAA